ncbi:MAG: FAD-dependent oxidoreductase, partial [Pseudomonadota bacterium]|nr:FAD-dependent oxidoreductase [Pseudomonadota bacterium]
MSIDILIIGGGLIGSSVAYHLAKSGKAGEIVVLEPDPTYEFATTPKGSGGVRRLFSRPENVALGSYGLEFYSTFKETMAINGELADISFKPQGYLFLSDGGDSSRMRSNYETQTANGVGAELLEQGDLKTRFPSVNFDDVEIGVLTPDDAWIDPHAAMMGFRRMARHLGVDYRKDRVVDWQGDGAAARHVTLESGQIISAKTFVLAAG